MAMQQEMRELVAEMEAKCGLKFPKKVAIFVGDLNPFDAAQLVLAFASREQPVDVLCPYRTAPEFGRTILDRGREFVTLPFVFALFGGPANAMLLPCDRMAIEHALRDAATVVIAAPQPENYDEVEDDSTSFWVPRLFERARAEGADIILVAPDSTPEQTLKATVHGSGANLNPSQIPSGWLATTETSTVPPRPVTRATAVDAELARGSAILERSLSDSHEALRSYMHSAGDLVAFFAEINLIARGELQAQLAPDLGPWDFRERVLSATGGIPLSHAQLVRHANFIEKLHAGASSDLQHYALQLHSVWVDFQPITPRDPLGPHKLYFYLTPAPRKPSDLLGALLDLCTCERTNAPLNTGALIAALVENYKPSCEYYNTLCAWSSGCVASGCFALPHAACDHDRASCYFGLRVPEVWCIEEMLTAVAESCDGAKTARHLRTASLFELLSPRAVQFIGSTSAQELADLRELLARSQLGRSLCTAEIEASTSASSSSSELSVKLGQSRVLCHPERLSPSRRLAHITSGEVVIYVGSRVSSHRELAVLYESGGIRVLYQDPSAGCVVQLSPLAAPGLTLEASVDGAVSRLLHDFANLRHTLQGGGVWLGRPRPDPDAFERLLARTAMVPGTHPTAALRAFLRPSATAARAFKLLFSNMRVSRALDSETSTLAPADWLDLLRFDLLRIFVPGRLAIVTMYETLLKFRARVFREERADWTEAVKAWLGDTNSGPELFHHFYHDLRVMASTLATEEKEKRLTRTPPAISGRETAAKSDLLAALWAPKHVTDNPRQLRADLACLLAEPELLAMIPYLPYARDTLVGAWLELETARGPLRERYAALADANLHSDNVQRYRVLFPAG